MQWHSPLFLVPIQVPTVMPMSRAVGWFLQESPFGSTPAPSVAVTTARTPATGRETASPPVPASKTARPSHSSSTNADIPREQQLASNTYSAQADELHAASSGTGKTYGETLITVWKKINKRHLIGTRARLAQLISHCNKVFSEI